MLQVQATYDQLSAMDETVSASEPAPIVVYRLADRADAPVIAQNTRISSGGVADYVWSKLQASSAGQALEDIGTALVAQDTGELSYNHAHVVLHKSKPIGTMQAVPLAQELPPLPSDLDPVLVPYANLRQAGSLCISGLYIDPDYRGSGLGSRFLQIAETQAIRAGITKLSLVCFADNDRAMAFYKRHGFKDVAREAVVDDPKLHYSGDIVLLVKDLEVN